MSAELFNNEQTPFNLAGELLDEGITAEDEARIRALAEAEARKAQKLLRLTESEARENMREAYDENGRFRSLSERAEARKRRPHEARGSAASNACFGAY